MSTPRLTTSSTFVALSLAILKGFLRDRAAVFFAIIFPLMFLVLFGGIFSNQNQSKVDLIEVGQVPLLDQMPSSARAAFAQTFQVSHSDDLVASLGTVRKGDADVALEAQGNRLVAHYTNTDQVKAAETQGALRSFVDAANVATSGKPPTFSLQTRSVEDQSLKVIQYVTPGLLGWAVAMSASFGAAATLNGWRNSKLLRRLQLAPVSTATVVGARIAVTVAVALGQLAIFLLLGTTAFGLRLTGAWLMSIPLLVVGTLCFMSVGLLAGAVAKSTEGAVNMANFIVLPMSFLSGSFFPLDGSPGWLQALSHVLPLRWLNVGMTDVMVRGESPAAAFVPMAILAAFALVVGAIAARLFRWETT
ncbi:MAG: ABC transporter permease [Nocardioides sp.]